MVQHLAQVTFSAFFVYIAKLLACHHGMAKSTIASRLLCAAGYHWLLWVCSSALIGGELRIAVTLRMVLQILIPEPLQGAAGFSQFFLIVGKVAA